MILFAERPGREVFTESTKVFMDTWTRGRGSFEEDPPNAALVLEAYRAKQEILIAELLSPEYSPEAEHVRYQLVIEGEPAFAMPADFGEVTLVIDDYCCITGCSC